MSFADPATNLTDVVRPFAWVAAVFFLTGFLISLAAHLGQMAGAHDASPVLRPPVDASAPAETWNLRKAI